MGRKCEFEIWEIDWLTLYVEEINDIGPILLSDVNEQSTNAHNNYF